MPGGDSLSFSTDPMISSPTEYSAAKGRRFALTLAAAFATFSLVSRLRGRETAALVIGMLAALLLAGGIFAPRRLGRVERGWLQVGHALSRVTTPVFLGIIYFVVLAPIGILRRATGRNSLVHRNEEGSYWIRRIPLERDARRRRMERQF